MVNVAARRQYARYTLAGIRLFNGTVGLTAPELMVRRLEPDQGQDRDRAPSPAVIYAFRLFGIRTVVLGASLLNRSGDELRRQLQEAVLIHSSDLVTVTLLGVWRQLPPRVAAATALISGVNLTLALASMERNPLEPDR